MTTFKKIYTADYSAEGYHDGVADGKLAKPKSHFGILKINPANYIWRYFDAHDSYCKNYDTGYEKGQRVREGVYGDDVSQLHKPTLTKGKLNQHLTSLFKNSVQGTQMVNYRQQINSIQNCIDALEKDKKLFDSSISSYQKQIKQAESVGFYQNYTTPLGRKANTMQDKTNDFKDTIDLLIENLKYFIGKLEALERSSSDD